MEVLSCQTLRGYHMLVDLREFMPFESAKWTFLPRNRWFMEQSAFLLAVIMLLEEPYLWRCLLNVRCTSQDHAKSVQFSLRRESKVTSRRDSSNYSPYWLLCCVFPSALWLLPFCLHIVTWNLNTAMRWGRASAVTLDLSLFAGKARLLFISNDAEAVKHDL